jgi:hypothetical protein
VKTDFGNIRIGAKYKVLPTEYTQRWEKRFIGKVGICETARAITGAVLVFNTHKEVIPFDALQPHETETHVRM